MYMGCMRKGLLKNYILGGSQTDGQYLLKQIQILGASFSFEKKKKKNSVYNGQSSYEACHIIGLVLSWTHGGIKYKDKCAW